MQIKWPYDTVLRSKMLETLLSGDFKEHSFKRMKRGWGGDSVGSSACCTRMKDQSSDSALMSKSVCSVEDRDKRITETCWPSD